jgi:twinkle protein
VFDLEEKSRPVRSHVSCKDCGSSDARTIYDDGHSHCFSCGKTTQPACEVKLNDVVRNPMKEFKVNTESFKGIPEDAVAVNYPERGIAKNTSEVFGVVSTKDTTYFPYYDTNNKLIAVKKRGFTEKTFRSDGSWSDATLFGQQLFNSGGKAITIVEGEFDALACYQMTGSRFPVVSIRNGAGNALKDCRAQYEYLDSFEKIVICFDADEQGQTASNQVAELFGSKAHVFNHNGTKFKDACDYLANNEAKLFVDKWWNADRFVPDGIVAGSTLWETVNAPVEKADVMYPYAGINDLTYGIRKGELVTVTAGSGLGKSQFLREIVWQILCTSEDNIGLMFLEESVKKTAQSLMSLAVNKPLHLPDSDATEEERKYAFEQTLGTDRLYLFDHFGSTSIDNIINRVRFMAKGLDCKFVFLDHVSIVISAQESGDERKALDEIMTKLRMLVQETGICLFVVSHLKRPSDKGHEEGAATSLAQLRGSGSIAQLSDIVIGLERNGQHEDPIERNTTHVRVLKNRFSGLTGKACRLLYSRATGRMAEMPDEEKAL